MTIEDFKYRMGRIICSNLFCVLIVIAGLLGVFLLIERSDTAIMENKAKYRLTNTSENAQKYQFSIDEQRVANHFIVDTLPGLLQKGLIKKYKRDRSGTLVFVAGHLWNERTVFFRECLLKELFIYNKVNGYEASTRVMDSHSGKLYAEITPPARIEFYD